MEGGGARRAARGGRHEEASIEFHSEFLCSTVTYHV